MFVNMLYNDIVNKKQALHTRRQTMEYTTEQMTALTQISNILTANGLTVKDLPEGTSLNNEMVRYKEEYEKYQKLFYTKNSDFTELLYRILPKFYKEMADQTSEEEAYEWVEDNILSRYTGENYDKWLNFFEDADIRLKKYKVVEVSMSFKVVMPDEECEYDWGNYVDVSDLDFSDADTEVLDDKMSADEVEGRFRDLANCINDLN